MTEEPSIEKQAQSDEHFQLDDAPIIEAVIDIDCDMPSDFDLAATEPEASKRFADRYPNLKKSFIHQHEIQARPNEPPQFTATQALRALQFFSKDSLQLIQVRSNGYSFNRLRPYSSLDDYMPEIERTWRLFVEVAAPARIRRITLRYINRILLPMEEDTRVDLDEYLPLGPRFPEGHSLTYSSFLNRYSADEVGTGNHVTITLTNQKIENGRLPVIFDIEVQRRLETEPENWEAIRGAILSLRGLKNRVFKKTLSDKCLNLFRRPS